MPLWGLKGVLKDIAASTHGVEAPKVSGTVVEAPPPPELYSLHPPTEVQVATIVNPAVAVKVVEPEAPSEFPTVNESAAGVNELTEELVEPAEELPVEDSGPEVVKPESSYIETEAATVVPKAAVIVSAPEVPAVAYQM